MRAIELIVSHEANQWMLCTGEIFTVVFCSPIEVIAVSDTSAWLGRASQFVQEFMPVGEK